MKHVFVLAFLALSGCAHYTDNQLASMSDEQLCKASQAQPANSKIVLFLAGRKLPCHPAAITCTKAGFKVGTDQFTSCLQTNFAEINAQEQRKAEAWQSMGGAVQQYNATANQPIYQQTYNPPPKQAPVNCTIRHGGGFFPDSTVRCQ